MNSTGSAAIVSSLVVTDLGQHWGWVVAMGVLILWSAFFSGSEAALFSLREKERRQIRLAGPTGRRADGLLRNPDDLLSAILFWNLLINMTYFAIAAIVGRQLEADPQVGRTMAIVFTIGSLLTIIFFSEMLPKSFAVLAPVRVALSVAYPLTIAVRVVSPFLPIVRAANLLAHRLIWPSFRPEPELDLADIERAIELGTDDAALLQRERNVLRGLVAMADTRANELMRPRGRLALIEQPSNRGDIDDVSPPGGYLYVTSSDQESIAGAVQARMLRPSQWEDLGESIDLVSYVPWSAKISQVYEQLLKEDRRVAVVVNEFGESIGAITIEDILRSILSPSESIDEGEASIIEVSDGRWMLSGAVSLRALTKHLGVDGPEERTATVAGYVQRNNARLPRIGDEAELDGYRLTVVDENDDQIQIEVTRTARDRDIGAGP
ncbi:MAG: CNNM domain-containing protein [Planctomycetota bacterium]